MNDSQRITSPKQFDRMVKINGKWVWAILVLLVALMVSMVTFAFTQTIEKKIDKYGQIFKVSKGAFYPDVDLESPVMTSRHLDYQVILDNLYPDMENQIVMLFVSASEMNSGMFNMGTNVRVGQTEGVVIVVDTYEPMTYDEVQALTQLSDQTLMVMGVYPGQSYYGVLVGAPSMLPANDDKVVAAAERGADADDASGGVNNHWLDNVEMIRVEKDDAYMVPCEIIVQSVKPSSFILK